MNIKTYNGSSSFDSITDKNIDDSIVEYPIFQPIIDSIDGLRKLEFFYEDESIPRVISAHVFKTTLDDYLVIEGIVENDPEKSEDETIWKTFRVDKIRQVKVLAEGFSPVKFNRDANRYRHGVIAWVVEAIENPNPVVGEFSEILRDIDTTKNCHQDRTEQVSLDGMSFGF